MRRLGWMRGLFEREKCLGLQSLWRREDVEMLAAFWSLSRRTRAVFLIVSWVRLGTLGE